MAAMRSLNSLHYSSVYSTAVYTLDILAQYSVDNTVVYSIYSTAMYSPECIAGDSLALYV